MAKPEAVPKNQVCSVCGLDWSRHPENATKDDCIKLLRADLQNAEWRASFKQQWLPYTLTERPVTWRLGHYGEAKAETKWPEKSTCIKVTPMIEKTVTKTWRS